MEKRVTTEWAARRLSQLPAYLFDEIDRKKREALARAQDVIDFGVGDPDQPTHGFIVDRLRAAAGDPDNHHYAESAGMLALRERFADYFRRRFDVQLDPHSEVLVLLGAKEGIGHLATAVLDPGDTALVPQPGYPVYAAGTIFAGGKCHIMALRSEAGWRPVLEEIPADVCRRAKLMWLNYPNNPTAAVAPLSFFGRAVALAREYRILIAQDAAYSEIYFGDPPPSILQIEGAREVAVEFHSLSKTFNMSGWRVAFAVGNRRALAALAKVKSHLDSGVFRAVQHAALAALSGVHRPEIQEQVAMYRRRRNVLVDGLHQAGWSVAPAPATIYVWTRCPGGGDSMALTARLLDEAAVVVIPGVGFGPAGEGYVRFALTVPLERTREAVGRIQRLSW